MLDGETDVGYFDSFESAEDMAKYAEVFKKQRDVEAVQEKGLGNRNNWVCSSSFLSTEEECLQIGWLHFWKERSCAWSYYQAGYCQAPG
jgi:hypothetical protein